MSYAHADKGERCAKCNDYAARRVGTTPLCVDHFAEFITRCERAVGRRQRTTTN